MAGHVSLIVENEYRNILNWENLLESDHWKDVGRNEGIILKCVLEKWVVSMSANLSGRAMLHFEFRYHEVIMYNMECFLCLQN